MASRATTGRAGNRAARIYLRIVCPTYFGRCLGAVAAGISVQGLRASREPSRHRGLFGLIELVSWLMSAVHLRGLLERRQPRVEHAEIIGYAALAVLTRRVRPAPEPVEPTS